MVKATSLRQLRKTGRETINKLLDDCISEDSTNLKDNTNINLTKKQITNNNNNKKELNKSIILKYDKDLSINSFDYSHTVGRPKTTLVPKVSYVTC